MPLAACFLLACWIALLALACPVSPALARDADEAETIETDRPDVAETSTVVGAGRFQIETSVLWERTDHRRRRERLFATPTLLRLGFHPRWEARLETDAHARLREEVRGGRDRRTAAFAPLALGTKYHFAEEEGLQPSAGWLFHIGVPSGGGEFRAGHVEIESKLLLDWELSRRYDLGVNVGFTLPKDESGSRFFQWLYAVALNRNLSDRFRVYGEISGALPQRAGGKPAALLDGGAAYLLNPLTQLDFAVGTGIAGDLPDLYWTVGFSRKF